MGIIRNTLLGLIVVCFISACGTTPYSISDKIINPTTSDIFGWKCESPFGGNENRLSYYNSFSEYTASVEKELVSRYSISPHVNILNKGVIKLKPTFGDFRAKKVSEVTELQISMYDLLGNEIAHLKLKSTVEPISPESTAKEINSLVKEIKKCSNRGVCVNCNEPYQLKLPITIN